ncbi:hypothetical protein Acy02nite_82090 [Actinoplanes cyaneus]|uniref:Response regulatory domain-containing protein n=1 Tax=Actinoplanes cyaneus TaxID=52696 RepID=A0A919MAA8_9ACTN|nr:hypothetical protein [Actinoplanes cyaneus]GID70328.1 hypothetical protein Acy02nite_82090 [Actinoplanes cyaneus]
MIRIVLVDDQHLVRAGFRMVLDYQDDMTVVGEAATAPRRRACSAAQRRTSS